MTRKVLVAACAMLAMGAFGVGGNEASAQCRTGFGGGSYLGGGYSSGFRSVSPYRTVSIGINTYNRAPGFGYSNYRNSGSRGFYGSRGVSLVRDYVPRNYNRGRGRW